MQIKETELNKAYKTYCKNKGLDILSEELTKLFMRQWMEKRNFTRVKKVKNKFIFI